MPIRTFLVDRHQIVRTGLALALRHCDDIQVVGDAGCPLGGMDLIVREQPDVLILDTQWDSPQGDRIIQRIQQAAEKARILILTDSDCADRAASALDQGAAGYLVKDASVEEVIAGIRAVHAGRVFISHTAQTPKRPYLGPRSKALDAVDMGTKLSQREVEVVKLLANGMTNKEVAQQLFISVKTVETYRSRLMRKLGIRGRSEIVDFARRLESTVVTATPSLPTSQT